MSTPDTGASTGHDTSAAHPRFAEALHTLIGHAGGTVVDVREQSE